MDKKNNKFKNFIKKEGFYITLFVCLCIVATAAIFTVKTLKSGNQESSSQQEIVSNNNEEENKAKEEHSKEKENAEQVKKESVTDKDTKSVSNTTKINFVNPIENSNVIRGFSDKPVYNETLNSWIVAKGVAVSAEKGTKVLASAEGKVVESGQGDGYLGNYVKIAHPNGLYTIYSNLDSEGLVKKDTVVKAKDVIGKVGTTATNFKFEKHGDHLGLQVVKQSNNSTQQLDPTKYITFNSAKDNKQ